MSKLLTASELAKKLRMSTKTIYRLAEDGRIPYARTHESKGSAYRFEYEKVLEALRVPKIK